MSYREFYKAVLTLAKRFKLNKLSFVKEKVFGGKDIFKDLDEILFIYVSD